MDVALLIPGPGAGAELCAFAKGGPHQQARAASRRCDHAWRGGRGVLPYYWSQRHRQDDVAARVGSVVYPADLSGMRKTHAEGASVCEAHPDLEVFRLRFGKALDFDFFEDWQGSLFSRADPRNGGPSLDIERAMTKLEKVALRYTRKNGRPLVMAFTSTATRGFADPRHPSLP